MVDDTNMHAFDQDVRSCSRCRDLPVHKQCVQEVPVRLNEDPLFRERWEGVGLTRVPEGEQMKPRKVSNSLLLELKN